MDSVRGGLFYSTLLVRQTRSDLRWLFSVVCSRYDIRRWSNLQGVESVSRGNQILRQWNLLRMLQTRGEGVPFDQLATEADVSERTIQRDFEILQELGFPIDHDDDEYGKRFWRMPHDFFRTGPFVLSLTEAISLHLAERLLTPFAGTFLADGLQTVLDKVRSLVPQKAMDYFAPLDETIYVRRTGVTDYSSFADTIRTVVDGARDSRTVEARYRAIWRGDEYTTRFDPYGMVFYDGDLFAVGRSHRADAIRIFKVTRILSAEATTDSFERPANFSLEDQFRSSFGIFQASGTPVDISVKFSGGADSAVRAHSICQGVGSAVVAADSIIGIASQRPVSDEFWFGVHAVGEVTVRLRPKWSAIRAVSGSDRALSERGS